MLLCVCEGKTLQRPRPLQTKRFKDYKQMTFIITATVAASIVYFFAAFVHYCAASICQRHKAAIAQTVSEIVEIVSTVTTEETTPVIELPDSIRGLRQFVRENTLQAAIKSITGKSVSNLNKGELHQAVMTAIT